MCNVHSVWSPFPQGRHVSSVNAELNHVHLLVPLLNTNME